MHAVRWTMLVMSCACFAGLMACEDEDDQLPGDGDSDGDNDPLAPRAALRVVHGSPDAGNLSVTVSSAANGTTPLFLNLILAYTQVSPVDTVPADEPITLELKGTAGTLHTTAQLTLAADKTYLAVVMGYAKAERPEGAADLRVVVFEDNLSTPTGPFAHMRFVNAVADAPSLDIDRNYRDILQPFFGFVPFGEGTLAAGGEVPVGERMRLAVFSPERVEAMFSVDLVAAERMTAIAVGSRGRELRSSDGLRLLLVPPAGAQLRAQSPVRPAAAVYLLHAYPLFGPVTFVLGRDWRRIVIDQDLGVDGVQPTAFGQVTPRVFVEPSGGEASDRQVAIEGRPGHEVLHEQLPELTPGSTNVFVLTGLESPGVGQNPLTVIGPITLPPAPTGASASVTLVQAGADANELTFALAGGSYSVTSTVAFAGVDATTAVGVPLGDVTLDISEASYTKTFSMQEPRRHVLVSYGIAAPANHSFRCGLLSVTANGQVEPAITLIE